MAPTTSVLDNFNRANETPLGAGWTQAQSGDADKPRLVSNAVQSQSGDWVSAVWDVPFGANQEVYFTAPTVIGGRYIRAYARVTDPNSGAFTGYLLRVDTTTNAWELYRYLSGSSILIESGSQAVPNGGKVWLRAQGSVFTATYIAPGGAETEVIAFDDTTNTVNGSGEGQIGFGIGNGSGLILDDFGGGEIEPPAPPENSVAPAVTGTSQVGETLSCDTGTWANNPTSFAYQWQRDNEGGFAWSDISGETDDTLVLTDTDTFCNIRCVVTAANTEGDDTAASNTIGPVAAAPLEFTFRLSGGSSNTDPTASIGGAESSHVANGAVLFGSVPAEDAEAGLTEHRWIYLHNEDTQDATVTVYLVDDDEAFPGREFFAIGVATEAAGEAVGALPDAETAPGGVSFGVGTSPEAGEDAGTVTAGDGKGICIRRAIPTSTPSGVPHNEARVRFEITPVE